MATLCAFSSLCACQSDRSETSVDEPGGPTLDASTPASEERDQPSSMDGGEGGARVTRPGSAGGGGAGSVAQPSAGAGGVSGSGGVGDAGVAGGPGVAGSSAAPSESISCSATLLEATAPVLVSARINCSGTVSPSVAPGVSPNGYVSTGQIFAGPPERPSFLVHITPDDAEVEQLSDDLVHAFVASDAAGSPRVVETLRDGSVALLSRDDRNVPWVRTQVTPVPTDETYSQGRSAVVAADGTEYLVVHHHVERYSVELASRAPGGTFTITPVAPTDQSALTLGADGNVHVGYRIAGQGVIDWQPGGATETLVVDEDTRAFLPLTGARPGGPATAFSLQLADGIRVLRSTGSGPVENITIPDTAEAPYTLGSLDCSDACEPFDEEYGAARSNHGLAQTDDGTLWLGLERLHIARTIDYRQEGESCSCVPYVARDESTAEFVIERLAPGESETSGPLFSFALQTESNELSVRQGMTIDMVASRSLLYLAIQRTASANPGEIEYFVIDTTLL